MINYMDHMGNMPTKGPTVLALLRARRNGSIDALHACNSNKVMV